MTSKSIIFILASAAVLSACAARASKAVIRQERSFPMIAVPSTITDIPSRIEYTTEHFWDRFLSLDTTFVCDSVLVNGITQAELEQAMGNWAYIAGMAPVSSGRNGAEALYHKLESFSQAFSDTVVASSVIPLVEKYLYDPNSPVRNEDVYQRFADLLSRSSLVDEGRRMTYAYDAGMAALNSVGTPAADFRFTDTEGRIRSLYGIKADYLLLIFGNPGCGACKELMDAISSDGHISSLIASGRLKVADIYIDNEVDDWKSHINEYPAAWINGYDHLFSIRTDRTYHIRAIPSMYLLDASKKVILKDANQEVVLSRLSSIQ